MSRLDAQCDMDRIVTIVERARHKTRITPDTITRLEEEKARLLQRGQIILMSADYEARERWLNEYHSLCRRINEDKAEIEAAA
jgi:hypothetical protein